MKRVSECDRFGFREAEGRDASVEDQISRSVLELGNVRDSAGGNVEI